MWFQTALSILLTVYLILISTIRAIIVEVVIEQTQELVGWSPAQSESSLRGAGQRYASVERLITVSDLEFS